MNRYRSFVFGMLVVPIAVLGFAVVYASSVTIPNTFTAGTPAVAAQVNANFAAVKTAVDDNDTRITALESAAGPTSQGQVRGYVFFSGAGAVGNSFMTTGGTPTVTRTAVGDYTITWPGEAFLFSSDPTAITLLATVGSANGNSVGGDQLIRVRDDAGVAVDPNTVCVVIYND